MDKDQLDGIIPFLAVARHLSFTRAAGALNISPTAVSKAIRQLEQRHGVVLFQRTTRSVVLTEPGTALLRRLQPAAAEIGDALAGLSSYQTQSDRHAAPHPVTHGDAAAGRGARAGALPCLPRGHTGSVRR